MNVLDFIFRAAIIFGTPMLALFALIWGLSAMECASYERITGRETKMSATCTCYIKQGGEWFTYEERKMYNATGGVS